MAWKKAPEGLACTAKPSDDAAMCCVPAVWLDGDIARCAAHGPPTAEDGSPKSFGDWPNEETRVMADVATRVAAVRAVLDDVASGIGPGLTGLGAACAKVAEVARSSFLSALDENAADFDADAIVRAREVASAADWQMVAEHLVNQYRLHAEISRTLDEFRKRVPAPRHMARSRLMLEVVPAGDGIGIEVKASLDDAPCCPICGDLAPTDDDLRDGRARIRKAIWTEGDIADAAQSESPPIHIGMCAACQSCIVPPGSVIEGIH